MESHSLESSVTGLLYLASHAVNSSRLSTPITTSRPLLWAKTVYIIWVHQPISLSVHHLEGHLGLSHFLANVHSAAMNMGYTRFCVNMFLILWGTRLAVGWLGNRVMPYLAFWVNCCIFQSRQQAMRAPISQSLTNTFYFPFLTFLVAIPVMWSTASLRFWFAMP